MIRANSQKTIDYYNKLKRVNVPYARMMYIVYEKRISDICMMIIEDVCARLKRIEVDNAELSLDTTLFEFYLQRYATLG